MALLTLKDIGKIYVSEGNVAVGIRGVNLSFDRGEFVAVTGKSGSGKSTLLNVISGMDSYEEGEMYVEGQTTSHYLQPEWEEYRQKYISFIFQDYNIIESFTVLQNVELALMHIEDKKERRERALELLRRVGLSSHIKQKGSKLSGGQKQRTVIARALAKDSPIILADEPTGNLDSATSAEIIELLREVSRDKLLIVVTHNFEQVEKCATRHIRIFDGAVESDHVLSRPETDVEPVAAVRQRKELPAKKAVRNGLTLGRTIFTAKPKLSFFLCMLMIIGTLGVFLVTSLLGEAAQMFEDNTMFTHIDGRVVVTNGNGEVISREQLDEIARKYGAEAQLAHDVLLDMETHINLVESEEYNLWYVNARNTYGEDFGDDIIGRYPEKANEVFLYVPISYKNVFGDGTSGGVECATINWNHTFELEVVGVKYYYDNNIPAKCLFTEEGFRTATAVYYLQSYDVNIRVEVMDDKGAQVYSIDYYSFYPSFDLEGGDVYIYDSEYYRYLKTWGEDNLSTTVSFTSSYYNYNYYYYQSSDTYVFSRIFDDEDIVKSAPDGTYSNYELLISTDTLCEMAEEVLSESYSQASLFFANDKEAREAARVMRDDGYIAVSSDTTYVPDASTTIMNLLLYIMMAFVWLMAILFLAFFINLCSSRALSAFKSDMAIMRSMGIGVRVIQVSMYVRMLIALIPAYITVIAAALIIFLNPTLNGYFVFLYPWQYALIFVGMLILTARITYKQVRKLFRESVKKSLKGGNAE
ncbi:MAG: ATP-binding cassette domain-containing protein [Clostridia bacterium]|nr:ATP-binding cassette domain-containing protein [Clostridia bacterium]